MANFFENFGNERNCKEIPDKVLELNTEQYKGNFSYIRDNKTNNYYLNLSNAQSFKFTLKDFEVVGIEKIKKICGKENLTMNDLFNYSTNAMEYIEIKPKKESIVKINDVELNKDDIILSENIVRRKNEKFYIKPENQFKTIPLKITETENGNVYDFIAYQKPCKSLYKRKYAMKDDKWLIIDIDIDRKKGKIHFKYTLNNKVIKTAEGYLSALKFVKNADKNTIDILGIKYNLSGDKNILPDDSLIEIWENIVALEKELGFKFELGEDKTLSGKEIIQIKKLYRTLVEKKPFKSGEKLNNVSFDISKEGEENIENLINIENKIVLFKFSINENVKVAFSKSIELCQLDAFLYLKYDYYERDEKNNTYKVYFKDDKDYKRYTSTMFFKTEEEMNQFKSKNNFLNILAKAEELKV